jgi:S1-C subfamily serine protease
MKLFTRVMILLLVSLLMISFEKGSHFDLGPHAETTEVEMSEVLNEIPRRLRRQIVESTFKIVTDSGHGTGTYMIHDSNRFILTASHVIRGSSQIFAEVPGQGNVPLIKVYEDPSRDIAILRPEIPIEAQPIRFKRNTKFEAGERTVYAGFPSSHDVVVFTGTVAGKSEWNGNKIIMHSYAWPGASGSAVFDFRGRLIGILIAIDIARDPIQHGMPRIVEDIVWIEPTAELTNERMKDIFSQ